MGVHGNERDVFFYYLILLSMNSMQNFKITNLAYRLAPPAGTRARTQIKAMPQGLAITALSLHEQFVRLGLQRNKITYQLLALLPEIYKQEIYKEKGYATIFEYAGKLAGLSRLVIEKTLRVAHRLEDKPHLQAAVKTAGIHKVAMVATLATSETEKAWADKVLNMSYSSLNELTKEVRQNVPKHDQVANIFGANFQSTPCRAAPQKINIELDAEMQFLFLRLKSELEKKTRQKFSNKEAFRRMLLEQSALMKQRTGIRAGAWARAGTGVPNGVGARVGVPSGARGWVGIVAGAGANADVGSGAGIQARATKSRPQIPEISKFFNVEKIAKNEKYFGGGVSGDVVVTKVGAGVGAGAAQIEAETRIEAGADAHNIRTHTTRYIPIKQKKMALQKTTDHCGYPGCAKPVELFHHRERFSENKSHNSIIPLCKEHHEFMHNGLIENETGAPENWKLRIREFPRKTADLFFRKYRKVHGFARIGTG